MQGQQPLAKCFGSLPVVRHGPQFRRGAQKIQKPRRTAVKITRRDAVHRDAAKQLRKGQRCADKRFFVQGASGHQQRFDAAGQPGEAHQTAQLRGAAARLDVVLGAADFLSVILQNLHRPRVLRGLRVFRRKRRNAAFAHPI